MPLRGWSVVRPPTTHYPISLQTSDFRFSDFHKPFILLVVLRIRCFAAGQSFPFDHVTERREEVAVSVACAALRLVECSVAFLISAPWARERFCVPLFRA